MPSTKVKKAEVVTFIYNLLVVGKEKAGRDSWLTQESLSVSCVISERLPQNIKKMKWRI